MPYVMNTVALSYSALYTLLQPVNALPVVSRVLCALHCWRCQPPIAC